MIEETYVNFETAKLLKEKGFDEICSLGYNKNGDYIPTSNRSNSQIIQPDFCLISCPTLQMTMRWLREVHNKYCDVSYDIDYKWYFQIIDLEETIGYNYLEAVHYHDETDFNTYEEAAEVAIQYSLKNLI